MKKNIYIIIALFSFIISPLQAQLQLSDSAKISMMTTSPWDGAIYAVYGHTAVYVQDDSTGVDAVFNYGFFDMSKPHFLYDFVRGKTDYILGVQPFNQFISQYGLKGVEVVKQELHLSQAEKQALWEALYINSLPENRGYRYNFFFDNCVTRPRDLTEKYVSGKIEYPADTKTQTFRDLIHECVNAYPWMKFGIDLVIGSDADKPITLREKMFLPVYLLHAFDKAQVIVNDTLSYPLVKNKEIIIYPVNQGNTVSEWSWFSPNIVAFALFLVSIFISIIQYIKLNKTSIPKIYDTLLFAIVGMGGLLIFFLMFFSEHPATNPNWNFVWINFFALIFAVLFWVKSAKNVVFIYHFINFAVLSLFLLLWWLIPQKLPMATIFFSMSLWLRSGMNLFVFKKMKLKKKHFVSSKYLKSGWGQ